MTRSVVIVQRRLPDYRVPLFERMRTLLAAEGVQLRLLHGQATPDEQRKNDQGEIAWAEHLSTRYALDGRLCWMPYARQAAGADLVIVTQENKLVHNLGALMWRRRWPALAFWGHGRNLQTDAPDGWAERFKRSTTRHVDWWFAYTALSAGFVEEDGFPRERVTVVNNSIDTQALRRQVQEAAELDRAALRRRLGLSDGPIGLFIGSLYDDKRLPFLLAAARALHAAVPGFQLVIAGDGPDRAVVEAAAAAEPCVHYVGRVIGARKAELLVAADLFLNPGLVGLGILDAFVAGLPLVTTDCGLHSPEIAYLDSGNNGVMCENTENAFVSVTTQLFLDGTLRHRLAAAALAAGEQYSVENMASRFTTGVMQALRYARPGRSRAPP